MISPSTLRIDRRRNGLLPARRTAMSASAFSRSWDRVSRRKGISGVDLYSDDDLLPRPIEALKAERIGIYRAGPPNIDDDAEPVAPAEDEDRVNVNALCDAILDHP